MHIHDRLCITFPQHHTSAFLRQTDCMHMRTKAPAGHWAVYLIEEDTDTQLD